ncbi:MAG: pyrroline-5-carboxylate reductase [Ilumatobacter sp.]|uniref:pyrroline-5-carboxylate reductase n=1 Tax=Ilumatobacter sp. TaxID=1967498 RepID=UPI00391A7DD4
MTDDAVEMHAETEHAEPPFEIVMVGGGNMGAALASGMIDAGVAVAGLAVVEVVDARRDELAHLLPGVRVVAEVPPCRAAVIAVKPASVAAAIEHAVAGGARRILSIAAGVTLESLERAAGADVAVVRCMPNTPALVGEGASAIVGGSTATDDDLDWAESILASVGIVERLPEPLLDVFTGVAGSGPAYVFLVAEALTDAAVVEGLPRATAERVVTQLLLGSSTLLARDGNAAQLRANVTSPGGTTAAGLARLERHAVRAAFGDAVTAATARSRELG